jgi:hypothetical protein
MVVTLMAREAEECFSDQERGTGRRHSRQRPCVREHRHPCLRRARRSSQQGGPADQACEPTFR